MSSPDELTFGNSVAAIHDVDALTTWRCRHPFAEPLSVRVSTDTCKQVARVWLPDWLPI
jgi:hypothetical protein